MKAVFALLTQRARLLPAMAATSTSQRCKCDESKLAGSTLWPAASRHITLRVLDGLSNYGLKWTTTSVVQHWPGQVHATHFMSRPPALSRQALAPLVHPVSGGGV